MDDKLQQIYTRRFSGRRNMRAELWKVLIEGYFQKFIPPDSGIVLEIAAGHCEFINAVRAGKKIAADINPDTATFAAPDVQVILTPSTDLSPLDGDSIDTVFISNFLEHISKKDILRTFAECRRVLRTGGKILILQPNIRFRGRDYWMFFDHITPMDDRSLCEALEISGFTCEKVIPRFLPYTTSSGLPTSSRLVRLYLKLPFLWRFFGGQAFVIARK